MNKYKLILYMPFMNKIMNEDAKLIKELVERATPKKIISNGNPNINLGKVHCPECYSNVLAISSKSNYCSDCGQALDWSE